MKVAYSHDKPSPQRILRLMQGWRVGAAFITKLRVVEQVARQALDGAVQVLREACSLSVNEFEAGLKEAGRHVLAHLHRHPQPKFRVRTHAVQLTHNAVQSLHPLSSQMNVLQEHPAPLLHISADCFLCDLALVVAHYDMENTPASLVRELHQHGDRVHSGGEDVDDGRRAHAGLVRRLDVEAGRNRTVGTQVIRYQALDGHHQPLWL
mmetsp:Transcript_36366/g.92926  ORF Transcript_36366/g.92926 Transcript_36366/m.92926 type:complete len:208 (-) Transcript_36366:615-1238(-)